jgi:hypothetical protein
MTNMIAGQRRGQTCNLFFDIDHKDCRILNLRATTGGYDAPRIEMSQREMEDLINEITYQVADEVIVAAELYMAGKLVNH